MFELTFKELKLLKKLATKKNLIKASGKIYISSTYSSQKFQNLENNIKILILNRKKKNLH